MGIFKRLSGWFPPGEYPAHYHMDDSGPPRSADFKPMTADVFREAPLPDDPDLIERRQRLKTAIFEAAFGTEEERRIYGGKCLPFSELSPDAVGMMPPALRASYEAELASSRDPRSGRLVRPYVPPGLVE